MTNIEINELLSVLETIRANQYPELPQSLIQEIVEAEFSSQDDRTKAHHDVQIIIDNYLKDLTF